MPPYSVIYSITCHLTPSIKNGDKKVGTTAQISWVLHIFAKAVRRSYQLPSYPLCTPPTLGLHDHCRLSHFCQHVVTSLLWQWSLFVTRLGLTVSTRAPVSAPLWQPRHLLQCLTDVTAHRGWSRPLLKARGVRLRRPRSLAGDPCFVSVCRLCQASLQGQRRGAERAIFAGSPFLLTALMTGVFWQRGQKDWGDEGVVLFKYFHLIFLSAWSRGCHTETIWRYDNLAFWAERDIFAAFNQKKKLAN